jgi:aspartyl aminopeptidase
MQTPKNGLPNGISVQVKVQKPILRIPMLAIHLNRTVNSEGFKPNAQTELVPVLATAAKAQLDATVPGAQDTGSHHSLLLHILAAEAGCDVADIVDLELNVCDTQAGQLGGALDEFVFCGRLDNLAMCWCSMQARLRPPYH